MIAAWLHPVLWREADWSAALGRVGERLAIEPQGPRLVRAARELGQALEHVEPDRHAAIAAYHLGGDEARARALAIELCWWPALARLAGAGPGRPGHGEEGELGRRLDEVAAWWDAGQPALAGLALAAVPGRARLPWAAELAALLRGEELPALARAAAGHAFELDGLARSEALLMAGRMARAAGLVGDAISYFEEALRASPGHALAAAMLLELALAATDADVIQRYLRLRLAGLEAAAWLDAARATAQALAASDRHRGLGLRLLGHTLERAYTDGQIEIPGHLAMWATLASHALASGTRRELLPLVVRALELPLSTFDRVWLAALGAEVSLRDAHHAEVAGAYAEIVAADAPDHPIVRELAGGAVEAAAVVYVDHHGRGDDQIDVGAARSELASAINAAAAAARSTTEVAAARAPKASATRVGDGAIAPARVGERALERTEEAVAVDVELDELYAEVTAEATAFVEAGPPGADPGAPRPGRAVAALTPRSGAAALRPPRLPRPADPPDALPRAPRVAVPVDLRLVLPDGSHVDAQSRDVSASGLFVLTDAALALGSVLTVALSLPGEEALTEETYVVRARVARRATTGYGLALLEPEPRLVAALTRMSAAG
jgi:hypothetical protein